MKVADHIIDIGPEAGSFGGELVAEGTLKKFLNQIHLPLNILMASLKLKFLKKEDIQKIY